MGVHNFIVPIGRLNGIKNNRPLWSIIRNVIEVFIISPSSFNRPPIETLTLCFLVAVPANHHM